MADPNLLDLARVAVAAPGWRLMDGMAAYWVKRSGTVRGRVRAYVGGDGFCWESPQGDFTGAWPMPEGCGECLPDLSDPATKGCLLALAREHQRRPNLCVVAMSHCRTVESDAVLAWFVFNEPMSGDGDPPEFLDPDGRWGSDSRCAAWRTEVDALVAALGESDE